MGECTLQIRMTGLSVVITYDVTVEDIEEDLMLDTSIMHFVRIQLKYDTQELICREKVVKGVARASQREYKARRLVLQRDGLIQLRSDNLF